MKAAFNGKGLVGVGLPRKAGRKDPDLTLATTVIDDTQPGGQQTRTRTYTFPFALASREADYRIACAFFEQEAA